ncbi:pseudouridine-5'-phosphatase-like isoform X1 [Aotus nancymaae]|uniref:pseudouridine-5'-phosphatase-like isoform X1 n=1 Tax=Aotus nancymaae TaxID=37293 RepID=UPI0030FE0C74
MMAPLRSATILPFDVDSLLLDTEQVHSVMFQDICDSYEKEYTWDVKPEVMGKKASEGAQEVVGVLQLLTSKEELVEESQARLRDVFPTAALRPGAEKLILHLRKHNTPFAVATNLESTSFKVETSRHKELFGLFHHLVLGDDPEVKSCKPDPAVFLACAKRFSSPPPVEECLVFEDGPNGVEAVLAAGMQVIMVPDGNLSRDLSRKATLVLSSLQDFQPQL